MMTDSERKQFDQWQKQWDTAAVQFAKDFAEEMGKTQQKPNEQPTTSWLTNTPIERDYEDKGIENDLSWRDIYDRSQNIEGLLTEVEASQKVTPVNFSKGETKPIAAWGAFTPTKTNPTTQSSVGPDGLDPKGGVRVTPNWIDGEDLRELDDIKRRIESMERKHHEAEVRKKPSEGLQKQLESLRDRVEKLSEKINRAPEVDVT